MTSEPSFPPPPGADEDGLVYRQGVGAVLFNDHGHVWVGKRRIHTNQPIEQFWQMPQGGIDPGESPHEAVFRELLEETGTNKAEIIGATEDWLTYDLPERLINVAWGGGYRGQAQIWFALRFQGDEGDFDVTAQAKPEFTDWQWVRFNELPEMIVEFKRPMYESIVQQFRPLAERIVVPS